MLLSSVAYADVSIEKNFWDFLNFFSITSNYQFSGGEVQKYFNKCNPCTVNLVVTETYNLFDDLIFEAKAFGGRSGRETGCVTITKWDIDSSKYRPADWCQNGGYRDIGYSPTSQNWGDCGASYDCMTDKDYQCVDQQIRCWRDYFIAPSNVEAKIGSAVVWSMSSLDQFLETQNLAPYVNDICRENIAACQRYNAGEESSRDLCVSDCIIGFTVSSDTNVGGFDIKTSPKTETYTSEIISKPQDTYVSPSESTDSVSDDVSDDSTETQLDVEFEADGDSDTQLTDGKFKLSQKEIYGIAGLIVLIAAIWYALR